MEISAKFQTVLPCTIFPCLDQLTLDTADARPGRMPFATKGNPVAFLAVKRGYISNKLEL
jgi:hypothetical protein